jgi:inorganic pyrophosphatase
MSVLIGGFIIVTGLIGLAWAWYNYNALCKMDVEDISKVDEERLLKTEHPGVIEIGAIIRTGAQAFITAEYKICSIFIVLMAIIVFVCVDNMSTWFTTAAFVAGAITSMFCGAFGMQIATFSNYRTTLAAKTSLGAAFKVAFRAGCAMGFTLVSVSMIVLYFLIIIYKDMMGVEDSSK